MTTDSRRRWLIRLGKLALVLLVLFIMLRWFESRLVYFPTRTLAASGVGLGRAWEDVHFTASDGVKLNGWFFPAETNSPRAHLAVLICHGNGGNISHRLELCGALLEMDVNVFVFDYRGYGRSEGKPSEAGTYRDAQGAYEWLKKKGFAETNIIAFGESLGGAVAAEIAARETVAGLVLQSTFTSVPELGAELYPFLPVRLISRIRYDTRSKLPKIRVPVLVMHSRTDSIIPFHHAERNFAAANEPKLFVETSGDHNDGIVDRVKFREALEGFLKLIDPAMRGK